MDAKGSQAEEDLLSDFEHLGTGRQETLCGGEDKPDTGRTAPAQIEEEMRGGGPGLSTLKVPGRRGCAERQVPCAAG